MKLKFIVAAVAVGAIVSITADAQSRGRRSAPRAQPTYSQADSGGQRMAGCGLGSMVVESNDKWSQVAASFLNGTGIQTFGISFGTSNCTEDGVATASREKDLFLEANLADLRRDVARGEGEYLSSLANLYGCDASVFGHAMHQNQDKFMSATLEEASALSDSAAASCEG